MKEAAFSLLRDLTEAHGAPGHEDGPRAIFAREMAPLGTLTTDRLGSVLCELSPGTKNTQTQPRVMITAHLDEVGFMVHSITESGFLTVVALGGWWTHTLLAQRVRIRTRTGREHLGIITSTPPHFLSETEKNRVLTIEQLYIDVGASSRRHAEEILGLSPGDVIVPDSRCTPLSDPDLLCAKAFDNRVGVAVTIAALQQLAASSYPSPSQLLGVATVQEEIGCRGAETAAALARPDIALVIEGTPADDTPGYPASPRHGSNRPHESKTRPLRDGRRHRKKYPLPTRRAPQRRHRRPSVHHLRPRRAQRRHRRARPLYPHPQRRHPPR